MGRTRRVALALCFQRALHNEFRKRGIARQAATVVTQVLVDRDDEAFDNPSKPIGSFMDEAAAKLHEQKDGWSVVEDAGRGWRRVVPSPLPLRIVQQDAIMALVQSGFVVIGVGGGGIPVVEDEERNLAGVEAVIDKDFAAALLATSIGADLFLISTGVEKVALNFNQADERWLDKLSVEDAKQYLEDGHFGKGSMEPKIRAVINFLEQGGRRALITDPANIGRALKGETGTHIS